MTEILRALSRELEVEIEQLIHRLICFADDLLLRWTLNCRDQVHRALIDVGRTLDVLEAHHLLFNPKKTVLLLRLEGSQAVKVLKHCTIKTKGGLFARIPRCKGETWLPLVHSHTYLGCKISYHCFEKHTLQYGMQIGTTAFQRLRPWLAKRHSVSTYTRAQVWKSCVLSSYLHGLAAAGVTQEGIQKLIHKCHAQLRLIGQSPSHITHETNADLFRRLALVDPAVYIQDQWKYHRLARQQAHLSSWKQEMEKSQTQKPLRVALFQQVCQTVLDRMLTFAKLSQTCPEWDQAIQGQLIIKKPQSDIQTGHQHGQNAEARGGPCRGSAIRPPHPPLQSAEEHLGGNQAPANLPLPASHLPPM